MIKCPTGMTGVFPLVLDKAMTKRRKGDKLRFTQGGLMVYTGRLVMVPILGDSLGVSQTGRCVTAASTGSPDVRVRPANNMRDTVS